MPVLIDPNITISLKNRGASYPLNGQFALN